MDHYSFKHRKAKTLRSHICESIFYSFGYSYTASLDSHVWEAREKWGTFYPALQLASSWPWLHVLALEEPPSASATSDVCPAPLCGARSAGSLAPKAGHWALVLDAGKVKLGFAVLRGVNYCLKPQS